MKNILKIIFIIFYLLITYSFSFSQCCPYINSVTVEPANPNSNDYLKIITQVTTPGLGNFISKSHYIQGDTIFIDACYRSGPLTQTKTYIDTFNIGYLTVGFYTIYFKAIQSSSAICDTSAFQIYSGIIEIVSVSGINSLNQVSVYELYPNPVTAVLLLKGIDSKRIRIRNILGEVLLEENANINLCENYVDFNLFSQGIYFVEITDKSDKVFGSKIIKK